MPDRDYNRTDTKLIHTLPKKIISERFATETIDKHPLVHHGPNLLCERYMLS